LTTNPSIQPTGKLDPPYQTTPFSNQTNPNPTFQTTGNLDSGNQPTPLSNLVNPKQTIQPIGVSHSIQTQTHHRISPRKRRPKKILGDQTKTNSVPMTAEKDKFPKKHHEEKNTSSAPEKDS
jgi:hypothetical protein